MLNRQKISTIKDKGLRQRLEKLLSQVTLAMRTVNFTGEFYIAGALVYDSIMNNNNFEDADVFVYDENAFNEVKEKFDGYAYQKHAMTGNSPLDVYETAAQNLAVGNVLQKNCFVRIHRCPVGAPEDVFKTFDFVNSMIAITSTGELVKHKNFSSRISVNLDAMSNFTFSRYFKYLTAKGAHDPDDVALRKIIDWVIDNPFKGLGDADTEQPVTDAINSLAAVMYSRPSLGYHLQYMHDRIVKMHSGEDRIPIFERLMTYYNFHVDRPCTEFALVKLINLHEYIDGATLRDGWKETYDEVTNKYPEYFI